MVECIDPYAGFTFRGEPVVIDAAYQDDKLSCIGLDPGRYESFIDPSFFIGFGIRAGAAAGISAEGNINMLSRVIQHRPLQLGEPLTPCGEISGVAPVPRGRRISTDAWFESAGTGRAVSVPRESLKPDLSLEKRGAGERPPPVVEDVSSLQLLAEYTLTPEATCHYSTEGNAIHYEMEAANKSGFRAPIIGGGMGVHFLVDALWPPGGLRQLDLSIYFRRPIFWDDTFAVGVSTARDAIALVKQGKVLTEARINQLEVN